MPLNSMPPIAKTGKREQEQDPEKVLIRLRREYEVLDREVDQNQKASIGRLRRSSRVVEIFQDEYKNLTTDLKVATAPEKLRQDDVQFRTLGNLVNEYSVYNEEVKSQKKEMEEVEEQIKKVAKNVLVLRKEYYDRRASDDNFARNAACIIDTLENRLDVQMKKFNVIVAKNRQLRDYLTYFLWDRRNFMGIWNKLIEKLTAGKHIMLDLIEQATLTYDQREDWCTKLQMLRIDGHRTLLLNIEKMRKFRQNVDHVQKLQNFFTIKGQKRVMLDLMNKEKIQRTETRKQLDKKLDHYNDMINDIKAFTKLAKTDAIVQAYIRQESENFKLFEYVMEMIREAESANEELALLHMEIDKQNALNDMRLDQQRDTTCKMENDLKEATEQANQLEENTKQLDAHLHEVMQEIEKLFKICKCNRDPLLQLLGDQTKIYNFNVLLHLEILEKQIHQLLMIASYQATKSHKKVFSDEKQPKILTIENIVQDHPCALCLQQETVSDVSDSPVRVLSRKDAIERLKLRVKLPGGLVYIHRLSKCHNPGARSLLQQKYQ